MQFDSNSLSLDQLVVNITNQVSGSNDLVKFRRMYANDRIAFAHDIFPAFRNTIAFYQDEIFGAFDSGYRRVSVRGPHGLGKNCPKGQISWYCL